MWQGFRQASMATDRQAGTVNTLTVWVTNCMGTVNTLTVAIQYTVKSPNFVTAHYFVTAAENFCEALIGF